MASKSDISKSNVGTSGKEPKMKVRFDDNLFRMGTVGALKTHSNITDDSPIDDINAALDEVIELWEIASDGKPHGGMETATEALAAITEFIQTTHYEYQRPVLFRIDGFQVTLSVATRTPGCTANFTLSCTSLTDDLYAAMDAAYAELRSFASDKLDAGKVPIPKTQSSQNDAPDDEPFEFSTLRIGTYNGKHIARLMPLEGKWTQYGIPLYADEARKVDIDLTAFLKDGDYEVVGRAICKHKPDGKPLKAYGIELQ